MGNEKFVLQIEISADIEKWTEELKEELILDMISRLQGFNTGPFSVEGIKMTVIDY